MTNIESYDASYYWGIFKKRKKFFIIPTLVVLVGAILVARLLPSVYQSSSTILIEEQQIPPEFVRSTVTGFADQRIQSLTQQILSRVRLWEIIQQFNLYSELREKLTREEIIEKMRENIKLDTISAEVAGQKGGRRTAGQTGVTIALPFLIEAKVPGRCKRWREPWPPFI